MNNNIIVFIFLIFTLFPIFILPLCGIIFDIHSVCGSDPRLKRVLYSWNKPAHHYRLVATNKNNSQSSILVALSSVDDHNKYHTTYYESFDKGDSWRTEPMERGPHSNLNIFHSSFAGIMDSHDTRVRWHAIDRKRFALSKDGGQSWEAIVPKLDREGVIDHIELISAPNTNLSRLYAAIRINSYKEEYSLFKSEDYGHHFVYLSNEVRYATESRSDANLMIGYTNVDKEVNCWISISNDGGRSWRAAQYDLLNQDKVFQDNKRRMLRTGYEDEGDIELPNAYPVKQIETDPNDARTFYVVTWTGIYATGDLGKTFIHLPIATGYYNGVDNMAVDPIDSHIIYAIVKGSELYRSQDKGCTWRKLQLPTE